MRFVAQNMDNKVNGRMITISTSIADSTNARVSELIEIGYNTKLSNEPPSLTCMPSSVRNYGNAGTLVQDNSGGDGAVFKDCNLLDSSLAAKHFYDRGAEYLKCDSVQWEDFVKVQRNTVATSESLPGASLSLSSTTGACKFIKDEKEPSVIMDTTCPSFDPSSEIPDLDTCCDTEKKQLGRGGGESAGYTPVAAVPRSGLEGSPNFLIDLNQSDQMPPLSIQRTDSRCGLSGKGLIDFDGNTQLALYKTELPRWQMQTSPAEIQYWSQSAGMTEDQFTNNGFNGIQSQALCQRNLSPFTGFPG